MSVLTRIFSRTYVCYKHTHLHTHTPLYTTNIHTTYTRKCTRTLTHKHTSARTHAHTHAHASNYRLNVTATTALLYLVEHCVGKWLPVINLLTGNIREHVISEWKESGRLTSFTTSAFKLNFFS